MTKQTWTGSGWMERLSDSKEAEHIRRRDLRFVLEGVLGVHRCQCWHLCFEEDLPQPNQLLLLLREAQKGVLEVVLPQGGATVRRGRVHPEQPGQ